jgi:excisionase family DNA binding protein
MSTDWLSVDDIANDLSVPADRVRAWIRNRRLRAFKFGRDYRIKRADYDKFIEESATRPEEDRYKED